MKLQSIEAARGVAALLVVAFHGERLLALPQYIGHAPLGGVTSFMHAGVDFFFVLSGYIIFTVHRDDIGRPAMLNRYAMRRFSRIMPPYWVVTILAVLIAWHGHGLPTPGSLVGSLLLVPHAEGPIVAVAWTLEREMLFYLLFATAILNRFLGIALVAVWVAFSASGSHLGRWAFDEYSALFALGLVAARLPDRAVPNPLMLAMTGAATFLAAGLAEDAGLLSAAGWLPRLVYGSASAVLIVGVAVADRAGLLTVNRMLRVLGEASYAIYLVHSLVLGVAARTLLATGLLRHMPDWLVMTACCGAAVAFGLIFHQWAEMPMIRSIRSLTQTNAAVSRNVDIRPG